jgi:hypothetical protein
MSLVSPFYIKELQNIEKNLKCIRKDRTDSIILETYKYHPSESDLNFVTMVH